MRSTHISYYPLPNLFLSVRRVHILPPIKDICLIYVGQLCEDVLAVNFDTNIFFYKRGNISLLVIGMPTRVSI